MNEEIAENLIKLHVPGYQNRDYDVVDYRMRELDESGIQFRNGGGDHFRDSEYFCCLGAAQTLGCFCEHPYPALLEKRLGLPALNLGYGGAGPEFFVRQEKLHPRMRSGRFAVIQVMSGRSQSNSLFESGGLEYLERRSDGRRLGGNDAYAELLDGPAWLGRFGRVGRVAARRLGRPALRRVVEETRRAWVESCRELIRIIDRPTVLLWFSKRTPDYPTDFTTLGRLFGEFPQLVTREMVEEVAALCTEYVECVTDRGSPQPLFSRFTGQAVTVSPAGDRADLAKERNWTHNRYYPSPEMHEDAAMMLEPVCRRLLLSGPTAPMPADTPPQILTQPC